MLTVAIVSASAYLAGSLSTAYLLTCLVKGADIRQLGSGNAGALNVYREVGAWAGLSVLAADTVKGAAVVLVVVAFELGDVAMFAGALAVVIGHNLPVLIGPRGGKGVAPVFGISLAVLPVLTLVFVAMSLASGLAARNVVFGIAVGFVAINVLTVVSGQDAAQIALCLSLSAIIVATHFALSYKEVLASVRTRGVWGLFEVD